MEEFPKSPEEIKVGAAQEEERPLSFEEHMKRDFGEGESGAKKVEEMTGEECRAELRGMEPRVLALIEQVNPGLEEVTGSYPTEFAACYLEDLRAAIDKLTGEIKTMERGGAAGLVAEANRELEDMKAKEGEVGRYCELDSRDATIFGEGEARSTMSFGEYLKEMGAEYEPEQGGIGGMRFRAEIALQQYARAHFDDLVDKGELFEDLLFAKPSDETVSRNLSRLLENARKNGRNMWGGSESPENSSRWAKESAKDIVAYFERRNGFEHDGFESWGTNRILEHYEELREVLGDEHKDVMPLRRYIGSHDVWRALAHIDLVQKYGDELVDADGKRLFDMDKLVEWGKQFNKHGMILHADNFREMGYEVDELDLLEQAKKDGFHGGDVYAVPLVCDVLDAAKMRDVLDGSRYLPRLWNAEMELGQYVSAGSISAEEAEKKYTTYRRLLWDMAKAKGRR